MCSRHREPHGVDSAQGLANAIAIVEGAGLFVVPRVPSCIACSEPADPTSVWCKQHRLRIEEEDRL